MFRATVPAVTVINRVGKIAADIGHNFLEEENHRKTLGARRELTTNSTHIWQGGNLVHTPSLPCKNRWHDL